MKARIAMTTLWMIEDNQAFAESFSEYLGNYGFMVEVFSEIDEFLTRLATTEQPDIVILDRLIGSEDMLTRIQDIRLHFQGAVVILTGSTPEMTDRVVGLELGTDDFLFKTTPPREIVAHLRAVMRRVAPAAAHHGPMPDAPARAVGKWQLDSKVFDVISTDGDRLGLTAMQFRLLALLADHTGEIVSRDDLQQLVNGRLADPLSRNLDVLISQLRHKLQKLDDPNCQVRAIRGSGYVFSGFPA